MRAATLLLCLCAAAGAAGQPSRQPRHVLDIVAYPLTPEAAAPSETAGLPPGHVSATRTVEPASTSARGSSRSTFQLRDRRSGHLRNRAGECRAEACGDSVVGGSGALHIARIQRIAAEPGDLLLGSVGRDGIATPARRPRATVAVWIADCRRQSAVAGAWGDRPHQGPWCLARSRE
jgi:hypothetical protein